MMRWNISEIFFLGVGGRQRVVTLQRDEVNIITGASGTGKSTLIKAIDYCLGSSKCELAAHVKRRSIAVGVKWVLGESEMITGRVIPPYGQDTSTKMFVSSGRNLPLPSRLEEFEGTTNLQAGKAFIERAFGIGDIADKNSFQETVRGRATVRHVTAYMFVTKNIILNESALLHGLDEADEARGITETLPYFLRVINEETVVNERRLRDLQQKFDREERRQISKRHASSDFKLRATQLLTEASQSGLAETPASDSSEQDLLQALSHIERSHSSGPAIPRESVLADLHLARRGLLDQLETLKRKSRAAQIAIREASGFEGAVTRQHQKIRLAEHLTKIEGACPLCSHPSDLGKVAAANIQTTLDIIRRESSAVESIKPRLIEHGGELDTQIRRANDEFREVEARIGGWIAQNEKAKELEDMARYHAYLQGKISYFLETNTSNVLPTVDLDALRSDIESLEAKINRDAKAALLQRAERKISQFASDAFANLPTVAPCEGAELEFNSRTPEVLTIEVESSSVLKMPEVGSDQNYLAIHVATSFALQHYFETISSPVPGFLVFDQISRPYFPTSGDNYDETELKGNADDDDMQAMRKHINFLFEETERRKGLQVLLIEHAYFADDPRYVQATRERWHKASGNALIPFDWPARSNES